MWTFYAYLDIDQLGISCNPKHYAEIIHLGKLIKKQVVKTNNNIKHPYENALNFLYGTIFIDKNSLIYNHSKNVCIFAEGEVDRCATGSGISGRCAIHFAKKELDYDETIRIESIISTTLDVSVTESLKFGPYDAVIPLVSGNAYFTGFQEFWIDPLDPLKDGFYLR